MGLVLSHTIVSLFLYYRNRDRHAHLLDVADQTSFPERLGDQEALSPLDDVARLGDLYDAIREALDALLHRKVNSIVYILDEKSDVLYADKEKKYGAPSKGIIRETLETQQFHVQSNDVASDPVIAVIKVQCKPPSSWNPKTVYCLPVTDEENQKILALLVIEENETVEINKITPLKHKIVGCYRRLCKCHRDSSSNYAPSNASNPTAAIGKTGDKDAILRLCGDLYDQDASRLQLKVIRFLEEQTNAECAFLLLVVPETQELFCQVIGGLVLEEEIKFPGPNSVFSLPLESKKPMKLEDVPLDKRKDIENFVGVKLKSMLCVPVSSRNNDGLIALACVVNKKDAENFTNDDLQAILQCFQYTSTVLTSTLAFQNERKLKLQTQAMLQVARNLFTHLGEFSVRHSEELGSCTNLTQFLAKYREQVVVPNRRRGESVHRNSNGSAKSSKSESITENTLLELDKIDGISSMSRDGLPKVFKSEVFMMHNEKKECFNAENAQNSVGKKKYFKSVYTYEMKEDNGINSGEFSESFERTTERAELHLQCNSSEDNDLSKNEKIYMQENFEVIQLDVKRIESKENTLCGQKVEHGAGNSGENDLPREFSQPDLETAISLTLHPGVTSNDLDLVGHIENVEDEDDLLLVKEIVVAEKVPVPEKNLDVCESDSKLTNEQASLSKEPPENASNELLRAVEDMHVNDEPTSENLLEAKTSSQTDIPRVLSSVSRSEVFNNGNKSDKGTAQSSDGQEFDILNPLLCKVEAGSDTDGERDIHTGRVVKSDNETDNVASGSEKIETGVTIVIDREEDADTCTKSDVDEEVGIVTSGVNREEEDLANSEADIEEEDVTKSDIDSDGSDFCLPSVSQLEIVRTRPDDRLNPDTLPVCSTDLDTLKVPSEKSGISFYTAGVEAANDKSRASTSDSELENSDVFYDTFTERSIVSSRSEQGLSISLLDRSRLASPELREEIKARFSHSDPVISQQQNTTAVHTLLEFKESRPSLNYAFIEDTEFVLEPLRISSNDLESVVESLGLISAHSSSPVIKIIVEDTNSHKTHCFSQQSDPKVSTYSSVDRLSERGSGCQFSKHDKDLDYIKCQQPPTTDFSIISKNDLTKLLREIMQEARNLTQAERCSVFLIDKETKELVAEVFDGISTNNKEEHNEIRMPITQGIAGHVATTGNLLNIKDAYSHPMFYRGIDDSTGFRTRNILCFPIKNERGDVLGVAQLCNKKTGQHFTEFDEDLASAFAVYCCISISHSLMYQNVLAAQYRNSLANELMMYHMKISPDDVEGLLSRDIPSVALWGVEFDKFPFPPREIPEPETPLCVLAMFEDLGFLSRWRIRKDTLVRFVLMVKKGYRNPPYHNWTHAFAVAHFCFLCIKNLNLQQSLDDIELFALFVSCLCHDLDHRGTNNQYQVASKSVLAALYSSEGSVMERHHFAQTMCIVNTDGCNIFENLSSKDYTTVLDLVRDIILATDLAHHLKIMNSLKEMAKVGFDTKNERHHSLLLCLLMTASDLSDQTKPWDNTKHVAALIYREFFSQGDMEKSLGQKPAEMMDRERARIPDLQIGFLDHIALPVYKVLADLFPASDIVRDTVVDNRRHWEKICALIKIRRGGSCEQMSYDQILAMEEEEANAEIENYNLQNQKQNGR
nr:cGMP-dependent 3',5'-cyclic phosphodiesterase isoform X2 [Crassostrea gigas]